MTLTYHIYIGKEIEEILEDLGKLRISVFREFPYLYEGSEEYERNYLKTYFAIERCCVVAVFDGKQMVGASTCLPMIDESAEVQLPFLKNNIEVKKVFYFGESILLPQYRGLGIGNRFFEEREKHVMSFKEYEMICFCAVDRPENHKRRPTDYRPLNDFWNKRGFTKQKHLKTYFSWKDLDEPQESKKPMIFWTKYLK